MIALSIPEIATVARYPRTPELDPVTDVVEANDLFFGFVALADNAEMLHLEAG
jgi:hypothetical protein